MQLSQYAFLALPRSRAVEKQENLQLHNAFLYFTFFSCTFVPIIHFKLGDFYWWERRIPCSYACNATASSLVVPATCLTIQKYIAVLTIQLSACVLRKDIASKLASLF